jgi:hypothetical protein
MKYLLEKGDGVKTQDFQLNVALLYSLYHNIFTDFIKKHPMKD